MCQPTLRNALQIAFMLMVFIWAADSHTALSQMPEQHSGSRAAGSLQAQFAAGTTNGVRIGVRYSLPNGFAPESSIGYMRLSSESVSGNLAALNVEAIAGTLGLNWFSHPDNAVAPMFSMMFTYTHAIKRLSNYLHQRRFSITLAGGAEFDMLSHLAVFFRLGPSLTFLSRDEKGASQLYMHFDAGLGLTF